MGQEEILHKHKCKKTFTALTRKKINMSKKIKLLSFVLVVAMVFTFMAMSVSAATTVIQPRGTCPQCTNGYVSTSTEVFEIDGNPYNNQYKMTTCSKMGTSHAHYLNVRYRLTTTCRSCGYVEHTIYYSHFCPYGG